VPEVLSGLGEVRPVPTLALFEGLLAALHDLDQRVNDLSDTAPLIIDLRAQRFGNPCARHCPPLSS